jgi:hypothetical protein
VILVAGIPDEGPVARVIEALEASGAEHRVFDQRQVAAAGLTLDIADDRGGGAVRGRLRLDGETIALEALRGCYVRLMDDQLLPGIAGLPPDAPLRLHARRLHELLLRYADIAPCRVLNRPSAMASNMSKPYQAQVIRAVGLGIPETLITNDPDAASTFLDRVWGEQGHVVYKSISGIRSIVRRVERDDLARLDRIRWCPTQFQRQVPGTDVRVHVVGEEVLAVRIDSRATDYRYAAREIGEEPAITPVELDARTRTRCIALSRHLDLPLAGIDLRITPDGDVVCFEVNPSPAFSFYEGRAGVPIAAAVARYLAGE